LATRSDARRRTPPVRQHDERFLPEYAKYDGRSRRDPGYWYRPTMGLQRLERVRFPWFRERLPDLAGLEVLDLGCGGGILAEDLARAGARVTGVDPSRETLRLARAHARAEGLRIRYRHGFAERLTERAAYDLVFAVDVLEHVDDLEATLDAALRALRPGGWFGFLTHNATPQAFAEVIWRWEYLERTSHRGAHDFHRFLTPDDLTAALARRGARVTALAGLRWRPRVALTRSLAVTYMGLAQKRGTR
jgi:2-polyprenyl-6-hydroxyphenyl methylase/3-demethylubiquinone-9 3-methyltransferase